LSEHAQQHGFTALELMVALAIVAIVLAMAVPSFKNYGWNLRMKTAMDAMHTDLQLARGRAISHNIQTVMCPSTDAHECSRASDWHPGWIVFSDLNGDRRRQTGEPLLKHGNTVEFLAINSSRSRKHIRFYPNGSAPGSNTSIIFCDQRGPLFAGRISISNTGRIRMERGGSMPKSACL